MGIHYINWVCNTKIIKIGAGNMYTENAKYILELKAILASEHSDGYMKKWAGEWLREIEYQVELAEYVNKKQKTLVTV
jgi:hypothetical protein